MSFAPDLKRPRALKVLGAIMLLGFTCGCGPTPIGPVPPGIAEERYAWLQVIAADENNCPREQLTYEKLGDGRHMFKGCGREVEMLWERWALPAATNRFAKEVKCDIKVTKEERIDDRTHIVEGCGQRITYVRVCNDRCSWVANVVTGKP